MYSFSVSFITVADFTVAVFSANHERTTITFREFLQYIPLSNELDKRTQDERSSSLFDNGRHLYIAEIYTKLVQRTHVVRSSCACRASYVL